MENRNQPNRQSIKGIGKQFIKEEIQLAKKHFKIFFLIMEMRAKKNVYIFQYQIAKNYFKTIPLFRFEKKHTFMHC